MPQYSWTTLAQTRAALRGRLFGARFWTDAELDIYIREALRTWNALTEQWKVDFVFSSAGWTDFGAIAGSPRLRTVTDVDIYTEMQYMLLEPPTGGGAWTGTPQFNLAQMQFTLQKRRDEMIQATGCNMQHLIPLATIPGTRRNQLPDTVLEPHRFRFLPATDFPPNRTMTREDTQAFQYFEPDYLQTDDRYPSSWSVGSELPLAFDVNDAPSVPGAYDLIVLQSGPIFNPPAATLLGVPDDWSWVAKWGSLADLLSREPEATDRERAAYCLKRYLDGLEIMKQSNWMVQANINNVPVDTPSLFEQDFTSPEWEDNPNIWPVMVQGGIDFANVAPFGTGFGGGGFGGGPFGGGNPVSCDVTLVGNQPVPLVDGDYVQVAKDVMDVILAYAQRLCSFKMGGYDFAQTEYMEKDFFRAATETNDRLSKIGLYNDVLNSQGQRETVMVPR